MGMDVRRAQVRDPDAWLELAPPASGALCATLRKWIHSWAPDLQESIKWNMLCFSGRRLVCGIAACKHWAAVVFFRGTEIPMGERLWDPRGAENLTMRSLRLTTLEELDRRLFKRVLARALELDWEGPAPAPPRKPPVEWPMPPELESALRRNKKAAKFFASLAPSYQREYKVWVGQAKREETRARRLAETIRALAAGRKWFERKLA